MPSALTIFFAVLVVSSTLAAIGWGMTYRLNPENHRNEVLPWLLPWSLKGLVLPIVLWAIMNVGISWSLQPFMPQIQAAQNNGTGWFPEFLRVMAAGLFIVSSYWTGITLAWVVGRSSRGLIGEQRSDFKALCLTCFIAMLLPVAAILFIV